MRPSSTNDQGGSHEEDIHARNAVAGLLSGCDSADGKYPQSKSDDSHSAYIPTRSDRADAIESDQPSRPIGDSAGYFCAGTSEQFADDVGPGLPAPQLGWKLRAGL